MISNEDVKKFVLDFFELSNFEINESKGIYKVEIPERNRNYFGTSEILFSFDEKISKENNCELVIPGSKLLLDIILLCNNKYSVKKWSSKNPNDVWVIRFHFFLNFQSKTTFRDVSYVDVNVKTMEITTVNQVVFESNYKVPDYVENNISKAFLAATNEIEEESLGTREEFIKDLEQNLQSDYDSYVKRFDDEINELDQSIYDKEERLKDEEKMRQFRFSIIEKIESLEKVKKGVVSNLQKKYMINFNYELIAAEIFQL